MAFNWNQSAFADSLFHQAGGNLGAGDSSSTTMPVFSIPDASKQDQHTTSFVPWAHDNSKHYGNLTDSADLDWETDLQGLVSNIVEEADSSDGCFNEGFPPMCNSIWSPKTTRKEELQDQFDDKTQQKPPFPPNCTSQNGFSRAQQQSVDEHVEGLYQCLNGLAQQWRLNGSNGDNHSGSIQQQPQGLPSANEENIWSQQGKYDNDQPMTSLPDLRDVFIPPHEMNGSCFGSFYDEHRVQSSVKPAYHEPNRAEDVNQLMLHLQSLGHAEHSAAILNSSRNVDKQMAGLNCDDNVAEQWKTSTPDIRIPKQPQGEMKPGWRKHNGGVKKQTLKREVFHDAPDFGPQNSVFHQQIKSALSQVNFLNENQKKIPGQGDNFHMNGYLKQHSQLKQMQSNIKPQMYKEKQKMLVDGFRGGSSPIGAQTNAPTSAGMHQPISQDPYLDFHGRVQPQKFDGENGTYPVNELRKLQRTPFNYNTLAYEGDASGPTPGDMSEAVPLNYFARRKENTHQMTALTVANMLMNQGGPVVQFSVYLDECFEQWRHLEIERLIAEGFLMKTFIAQRSPTGSNSTLPKMSPTPAIITQLIVNQMREQTKVASLLDKIEHVHRLSLHANIHSALNRHFTAVCVLLERRKEADLNKQQQRPSFTESKDILLMDVALKELADATRCLRVALWCSLQMIILFPVKTQDQHVNGENESGAAPCQGYSFNK